MWALRIFCAASWPGLIRECVDTLQAVLPHHRTGTVSKTGRTEVAARWRHRPCLFPQHGPGRKHDRRIEPASRRRDIADRHPEELIRGLLRSDGCRATNRVRRTVGAEWKYHEYPRYFFSSTSEEIIGLLGEALDRLGVRWSLRFRDNGPHRRSGILSVAERKSVALLDSFVGPKH
ncbi:hypothetical protein NI17_003375 [Thermobifida halotolerans]|uniref:Homing endonuclease LAGLIDADG domain-containing protein n=1 Tax=Thermobifida halotolerans TaxID=483545 RepID=A0AA97LY28_9ACTN|nr:hypothetical protein [Thermobifida halotolerans]UOE20298.1 hypothetical protein NI17_003375 [Thermobifida halotolerans]